MGVNSEFGIKTAVDNSGIDSLLERLAKLLDTAKTVEKQFGSMFNSDAAKKMSQSFVDADGKITKSRQESSARVKQALTDQVNAEEAATKRRVEAEERSAQLTKSVENMTTEALVDDIFKLQQKRDAAIRARTAAAAEGAKAEVAEQKKVIASLDEEIGTLKKVSIQRKEVQKEGAGAKIGQLGTGREANAGSHEGGGIGIPQIAMLGAATEGLSALVEKSGEVTLANKKMEVSFGAGTDKAKEEAEEIGRAFGMTKDEAGTVMAEIHAATGANGEDLKKYTQAYIAAQQAGIQISAKSLQSQVGMQRLMTEGMPLVANAMKAAQEPAQQAALAQKDVEESAGELANTLLTGLGPILTDLIPLIGTAGDIASGVLSPALKLVGVVLTPVLEGLKFLKPILPELAIGAGILAAALNLTAIATWAVNAAMAVNPFVWIALAAIALVGGIVLLVKHWQEVIHWFKEAAKTVMNAGGALLSLLGITSDASAATKKHTDAVKDNSQAIADQKKAYDDATTAAKSYTDSIEANAEKQKEASDSSLSAAKAALADIDEKLADPSKRLAGDTEESLKKVRQQWLDNGKQVVEGQKKTAAELKAIDSELGLDKDRKPKKAKDTTAKDDYEALKKSITEKYDLLREKAEENATSDESYKAQSLELQKQQDEEMLAETTAYNEKHSTRKKSLAGMEHKIWVDGHNILKESQDKELKDADEANAKALGDLAVRGAKQNLTEREVAKQSYQIKLDGLNAKLALEKKDGRDTEATQEAIDELNRSHEIDGIKQTEAIRKELRDSANARVLNAMKSALEEEQSLQGNHQKEIAAQENAIATEEENERYAKELQDRKDDLANAAQGAALRESLAANHAGKMRAIAQQGADEQRKIEQEQIAYTLGPFSQSFAKASDMASNSMLKTMGIEQKHKTVFGNMAAGIISDYAKMGLSAIQHANISEIADDASAAGKWVLAAANAVAKAFESIPFPLDLVAAAGSIAAVVALAAEAKHIGGHAMGTDSAPGGMSWVGERGPELMNVPRGAQIIPNHHLPNLGQPAPDFTPLLHALNTSNRLARQSNDTLTAIHSSGKPGYGSSQGLYNLTRGQQMATRIVNRRQVK